jgi:hypothetical protein
MSRICTRNGIIAYSAHNNNDTIENSRPRGRTHRGTDATKLAELTEIVGHVEAACEVMSETVQNAMEAARVKWSLGDSVSVRLAPLPLVDLVSVVKQVQKRYHGVSPFHPKNALVWVNDTRRLQKAAYHCS